MPIEEQQDLWAVLEHLEPCARLSGVCELGRRGSPGGGLWHLLAGEVCQRGAVASLPNRLGARERPQKCSLRQKAEQVGQRSRSPSL